MYYFSCKIINELQALCCLLLEELIINLCVNKVKRSWKKLSYMTSGYVIISRSVVVLIR